MRTEIKALHQALKTTIVYVTHDQIEAMTMADRIVVMNAGRVEQVGSPLELYDRPVNKFVAGFLGSPAMGFIPGVIERGDGLPRLRTDAGFTLPLGPTAAASGRPARSGSGPSTTGSRRPGRVSLPGRRGRADRGRNASVRTIAGVEVRCVFRERVAPAPGSTLMLDVDPALVHVFDRQSGRGSEHAVRLRRHRDAPQGRAGPGAARPTGGSRRAVLDDPEFATEAAIALLAARAAVSEPTVTRFCRTLGCAGLRDFKLRLAQSLATSGRYLSAAARPGRGDDVPSSIAAQACAAIETVCGAHRSRRAGRGRRRTVEAAARARLWVGRRLVARRHGTGEPPVPARCSATASPSTASCSG